jgi:ABC-type glutathione transport system ATPase component
MANDAQSRIKQRFGELSGVRRELRAQQARLGTEIAALRGQLDLAPKVEQALEKLSDELFGREARALELHLTRAVQEVLEQPLELKVERAHKRGGTTMKLYVEREGKREDVMKGQGGSVANVLSVGLRLVALMKLDPVEHRKVLVLDEQDCWLAPELVPRLVQLVAEAARSLGFQVLMISHHDVASFEQYADRIIRLSPGPAGVTASVLYEAPPQ